MSNGGQLQRWQVARQLVVRMLGTGSGIFSGANQPGDDVIVDLEGLIENVQEIWLTEYMIRNNGTAAARNMWRVDLSRNNLAIEQRSNSAGQGFCIAVPDMTGTTHVVYDTPRVMTIDGKRGMSSLRVRITDEFGAPVTFHDVTLFLTIVSVNQLLSLADVKRAEALNIEWWRSNENVGRFKDRTTNTFV